MSDIPPDLLAPPPGSLAVSDSPGLPLAQSQWGIFGQDGSSILTVDSVGSVDYARDYHISDYPQEKGQFESYNKVKVPFHARAGFLISTKRTDFLNAVEAAVASLNFVTVVTPEITYPSANLTHYNYRRDSQHGRSLIRVDVWCEEVRIVSGGTPTAAQSTNAASPDQGGNQQATPTTQNPPAATPDAPNATPPTENDTGGEFTSRMGTVTEPAPGTINNPVLPGNSNGTPTGTDISSSFGPGGFGAPITVPAGVPNSTGGGSSATVTPLNDYVEPPPAGFVTPMPPPT